MTKRTQNKRGAVEVRVGIKTYKDGTYKRLAQFKTATDASKFLGEREKSGADVRMWSEQNGNFAVGKRIAGMTKAQIDLVTIGQAFIWDATDKADLLRSDDTARAFNVDGLPANLIASLRPTKARGKWAFHVMRGAKILHPQNSYDSKEKAFAALKEWLAEHA